MVSYLKTVALGAMLAGLTITAHGQAMSARDRDEQPSEVARRLRNDADRAANGGDRAREAEARRAARDAERGSADRARQIERDYNRGAYPAR